MDKKDSKPPVKARQAAERLKKGEGDIRARQRSFMKQRRSVLRPHDEPGSDAPGSPPQSEREESGLAQDDGDAPSHDADRQQQVAQYRRRQRKREDAPEPPADKERTDEHS